jgi:hypothetical protein
MAKTGRFTMRRRHVGRSARTRALIGGAISVALVWADIAASAAQQLPSGGGPIPSVRRGADGKIEVVRPSAKPPPAVTSPNANARPVTSPPGATPSDGASTFTRPSTPRVAGENISVIGAIQTLRLSSTSGATVGANTPSPPMFGLQFPSCTIDAAHCVPAGKYPQLQTIDGSPWPATFFNRASWSDGSIKHLSVLPGPFPRAIPTTGVTALVLNDGTAPPASGLTTTQLYAELMQVNANGFSGALGTGLGLQGNWSAKLANDANNVEVVNYGDGGGGRLYRILTHVQSGGVAIRLPCDRRAAVSRPGV